jgi:hypothetical protein
MTRRNIMTPWMTTIVSVAFVGLTALSVFSFAGQRRPGPFVSSIAILVGLAVLFHRLFGFPTAQPISASKMLAPNELPIIGVLFVCMLLGMLAHWLYVWLETPQRKRPTFDLGLFIAPVMASPIIFIPLLASQQNTDLDLSRFDIPRFMILLVAFENGFFWKEYFDNRKKKAVS